MLSAVKSAEATGMNWREAKGASRFLSANSTARLTELAKSENAHNGCTCSMVSGRKEKLGVAE